MNGRRPKARSKKWDRAVLGFVRQHFSIQQNDAFKGHLSELSSAFKIAIKHPKEKDLEAYDAAICYADGWKP